MTNTELFIDMPKALLRTCREDSSVTTLTSDLDIRLAIGVIADNYALDWGQVIRGLEQGHAYSSFSFVYELPEAEGEA